MAEPTVGAAPLVPPLRFRSVATPLRDVNWSSGISYVGLNCAEREEFARCTTVDLTSGGDAPGIVTWWPWTASLSVPCDDWVFDVQAGQIDDRLRLLLETATDAALAQELWSGDVRATNPNDATPPSLANLGFGTVLTSTTIVGAFASLLQARYGADCTATGGSIWHIPPQLIPAALDANQIVNVGGYYVGPMGFPVLTDSGYAPVAYTNAVGVLENPLMWISGPVRYAVGDITFDPADPNARRFDDRTNKYRVWAKRDLLVDVDPCCIFFEAVAIPGIEP